MRDAKLQAILEKYHVPAHIRQHMKKVAMVAVFLAKKIKKNGEKINIRALKQAALLHDLMKLCDGNTIDLKYFKKPPQVEEIEYWNRLISTYGHKKHVQAGYEVLMDNNEPEIAGIVKKHGFHSIILEEEKPITWEEKILYYADKRVKHHKVVSLKERLQDGRNRYVPDGNISEDDKKIEQAIMILENEICQKAGILPETITETLISKQGWR